MPARTRNLEFGERHKMRMQDLGLECESFPVIKKHPCTYLIKKKSQGCFLKEYIEERAIHLANYIIEKNATVRQTAKCFGISKSTVHKDVTDRLQKINLSLARQARQVLDVNKSERHIRGGMATKNKFLQKREQKASSS